MALTNSEVAKLYVAMFNRAPDAAGLDYWVNSGLEIEEIAMSFFDQPETVALYSTMTDPADFVNAIYSNLFNRAPDAAGLAYWVDQLTTGAVERSVMVLAVVNGAQDTVAGNDATILANKTSVGLYYVGKDLDGTSFSVSSVDATASSVQSAMASIDTLADNGGNPDVVGENYFLTETRDNLVGTANNDTFYGFVGQNQNGAVSNALSTGDFINGGTGTDTLFATIMNDNEVDGNNANFDINPRTQSVETVKLEVLDEGVVVDAGAMDSVSQFWSVNSDDSGLTLEDVRLGTKLSVTKDITFVMQDVDFGSDLTVGFDSNSFKSVGEKTFNSRIVIEMGDSNKPADSTNPLELITLGLKFTYDGTTYTMTGIQSADGTYSGMLAAISAALADEGLTNLIVQFGDALNEIVAENDTVPLLYSSAKQIIVTDPSGVDFVDFQSSIGSTFGGTTSSNPVSNTYAEDPSSASGLIESNLVLDNAGRGSTAGTVQIGAMSNSTKGIQQFNVFVDNSSAIAELTTTHDALMNVYISSRDTDTSAAGAAGDLEIGDINGYNDVATNQYLNLIDASAFAGANLMLGATNEGGNTAGELDEHADENPAEAIDNVKVLNANIAANVTFNASTTQDDATDTDTYMSYTTGSGNDTITVAIDGDSVDSEGEGLTINANSGNNTVKVTLNADVSQSTMAILDNLDITTTSGTDMVTNVGIGNFGISVGAGSDMVYIDSIDAAGTAAAAKGTWTVSTASAGHTWIDRVLYHATLTVNFAGFEQTVDIATTAASNFVATQMEINNAIKAAIAANPELARLLTTTDTTSNEQLIITSLVEGANDLTIDVFQPTAVTAVAASVREIQIPTSGTDFSALRLGLIQTLDLNAADVLTSNGVSDDSEDVEDAVEVAAAMNAKAGDAAAAGTDGTIEVISGNSGDGHLDATGAALANTVGSADETTAYNFLLSAAADGADETAVVNNSTIDMGDGANDLVVLNSNATSASTLLFSNAWGKVSVVNFFAGQANGNGEDGIANIAVVTPDEDTELSDAAMGAHIIDFTKWLDDKIDTSINTGGGALDSINRVATTDAVVAAATLVVTAANQVVIVNDFEKGTGADATETWTGLTAANLEKVLESTGGLGSVNADAWGNLAGALDAVVTDTADELIDGITDVFTAADTAKIDSIFMIENDDNQGEYKVFNVEWSNIDNTSGTGSIEDATVTLLGVVDFGESITAAAVFA